MIHAAFALETTWGVYVCDFEDGQQVRDEEGNLLNPDATDADYEETVEESLGILAAASFETEELLQAYRVELAKVQEVHPSRIKVLYLDPAKEMPIC